MAARRKLSIAEGVSFPFDAVTETFAFFAVRGGGKTYAAKKLAETMLEANAQIVVLDPQGVWWGLRAGWDSKSPGYPIPVFGGEHADLPLDPAFGEFMADLIVSERLSAVLDLKLMSKSARRKFVAAFAERILLQNRNPLHIFLEEAHYFAPQTARDPGDQKMLGAVGDLVTMGRNYGIGTSSLTQRAARLHKDVLEETDNLIVGRLVGPNDRSAVRKWFEDHVSPEELTSILKTLPSLPSEEKWVSAPALLGAPIRTMIYELDTFDSSASPKAGKRVRPPKMLADINLGKLEVQMSEVVERADAEDPKKLQRKIATLQKELDTERKAKARAETKEVEVPILQPDLVKKLDDKLRVMQAAGTQLIETANEIRMALSAAKGNVVAMRRSRAEERVASTSRSAPPKPVPRAATPDGEDSYEDHRLSAAPRRMLAALAEHPDGLSHAQLAALGGVALRKSTFRNGMSELRKFGLINENGKHVTLTEAGITVAGGIKDQPYTPEERQQLWLRKLSAAPRRMLEVLIDYQEWLDREELAERAEVDVTLSTFRNGMSELRRHSLIDEEGNRVRIAGALIGEVG